jgi:hypothetical protein
VTEEEKTEEVKEEKPEEVKAHISMVRAILADVNIGRDMALKVKVSCPSACDLRGKTVKIIDQDGVVKEIELVTFDGTANETDEFIEKVPIKPGEYMWTAVFPAQEKEGILHEESSAPFSFIVKPHKTSMSVWGAPSPIALNTKFKLKVGVQCFANCTLTGKKIEIYDHEGAKVATRRLGGVPWSGTPALYWAEVELEAPGIEGSYTWEAKFPEPDMGLPHAEAACPFTFRTARPPEHVVTVEVIDKDTEAPIKGAHVILHPYSAYTDEDGAAKVEVPGGEYQLHVWKFDYDKFKTKINVTSDISVKAELLLTPQDEEY